MKTMQSTYRNCWLVIAFLCLGGLQATVTAQSFEGIIDLVITNEQIEEQTEIEWHKKGNNHRLNIQSTTPGFSYDYIILLRENSGVMEMLTDVEGQKNVYTIPLDEIKVTDLSLAGAKQSLLEEEKPVSGYNCQLMEVKTSLGNVKYWLTNDLKIPLNEFPQFLRKSNYFKYLEAQQIQGLPVKIVSTDSSLNPHYTQTIKRARPAKINDTIFSIPASYSRN